MKNIINTFFKTTEERIRNPFMGAFITSWIVFNWKPIFYFILAEESIVTKIDYIEKNFNDIWNYLYFPLLAAVFYIVILPHLNLIFDAINKYSTAKKNEAVILKKIQIIEDEKKLAIEELKLEEAKTQFRERNTHNLLVDELQQQIKKQDKEFSKSKEEYQLNIDELKHELFEKEQTMNRELKNLRGRLDESIREKYQLQDEVLSRENEVNKLTTELEMGNNLFSQEILFDDGVSLRRKTRNGHVLYIDEEGRAYSEEEVKRKMENNNFTRN